MTVMQITPLSIITVHDHESLRAAWKMYGGVGSCVGNFVITKKLTASQMRRLSKGLRARLEYKAEVA